MISRRVRLASLLAFLFHGLLIITARYRLSYDAYVHMFFGDHYAKDWWSLWDARWYTGFAVSSYPPLVHQLIGLFSHLIGLDASFAVILWVTLTLYPLAVYGFTRVFVGRTISSYAALGAACLPSLYLSAHIFGQLPFLVSTLLALFGAASFARYLREGGLLNFALTIALSSTTMAAHHATLLLQPFLVLAVATRIFLDRKHIESRKSKYLLLSRLFLFGAFFILADLLVIWPFWDWGRTQILQIPIDHLSRHNFFKDPLAAVLFFLPIYGPLVLVIPYVFRRNRRLMGLTLSFILLFLIGLGDTTPLPRLLFGKGWEWLTYDRFALWASIVLLPFFGIAVTTLRQKISSVKIYSALAVASLIVGFVTLILPLQPGQVDMKQIVDFLNQGGHSQYRYLTFGFGDQLALLSTLTTATTMDGSYHTARRLPELRQSGIAQIDTVFWSTKGLSALDPILQKAGERGVRWGFVNVPYYIPVLLRNGWIQIENLKGGIQIWENPNAKYPETSQPPPADPLAVFSWGTFPFLSLLITLSLGSLRVYPIEAEKILRGIHASLIGLIPIGLCFWYYRTLFEIPHDRVYFTYDYALFFLSDAPALVAVILWLSTRIASHTLRPLIRTSSFTFILFAFFLLASISILWSTDWRTSLYISLHLWLIFALYLSLRDWPGAWKPLMYGFCAALTIQVITGFVEFAAQSTAFLDPLDMKWPGILDSSLRGASVVQLAGGESFLRAYGTLPHPNLLGGFTFVFLLGPAALFLHGKRSNILAPVLFSLGIVLLVLTFSRSAWLGLIAFAIVLILKSRYFDRKQLIFLAIVSLMSFAIALLPLRDLVLARTTQTTSHSEQFSFIGREWLGGQAVEMIREHPLTGVGIGSFILVLTQRAGEGYIIEPVHNLLLLTGAELGIPGLLLMLGLVITFMRETIKTSDPDAILLSATITGLSVISLFDHYLWTLAPGRLMLGLVLGLWAGQVHSHDA